MKRLTVTEENDTVKKKNLVLFAVKERVGKDFKVRGTKANYEKCSIGITLLQKMRTHRQRGKKNKTDHTDSLTTKMQN